MCGIDHQRFVACVWWYLRSDLCSFLRIHHTDVFEVFEGVLPVLLLGTHILLEQAEHMTGLQKTKREPDRWLKAEKARMMCSWTVWI